jgi:tellurium resistance protein TerZ
MISLKKNQTVSLKKQASVLNNLHFGLGWDPVKKKGFWNALFSNNSIDLDASCLMLDENGKQIDVVWFAQLKSKCRAVTHCGDNLTGDGDGDDEVILVDLSKIPAEVEYLVFTVNSFRGQTFNDVENAFCRVLNQNNEELVRYELTEQGGHTGIVIATLKRNNGNWDFTAQGYPCTGRTINEMYHDIVNMVVR